MRINDDGGDPWPICRSGEDIMFRTVAGNVNGDRRLTPNSVGETMKSPTKAEILQANDSQKSVYIMLTCMHFFFFFPL